MPTHTMMELLEAAFNVTPHADTDEEGTKYNDAAIETMNYLTKYIQDGDKSRIEGMLVAVKLMAEVHNAENPDEYVKEQIERGWAGERVEFKRV